MSKEEYLEYVNDQTKEITPLMYFFYKLKGGTYGEQEFFEAWRTWSAKMSIFMGGIHYHVFTELNKHFKI